MQFLTTEQYGNDANGTLTIAADTTDAPVNASCTGTVATTTLIGTNASFAANQILLIHQTIGGTATNWELNVISTYSSGTITTKYNLVNTYSAGAQAQVMKQYAQATVNSAKTLTSSKWTGTTGGFVGFLCSGTTTVTGTINANSGGYRGGLVDTAGEGTAGLGGTNVDGVGGGGGASNSGGGGGGGNGSLGTAGLAGRPAAGGTTIGNSSLTLFSLGGGGGGAGTLNVATPANSGTGGGAIFIISKTINVTGGIVANGQNAVDNGGRGAGGGAGGAILLKGQNITLGNNLVTALAGTGSSGAQGDNGGNGGIGRIHADYSDTFSGTTNPTLTTIQDRSLANSGGAAILVVL